MAGADPEGGGESRERPPEATAPPPFSNPGSAPVWRPKNT